MKKIYVFAYCKECITLDVVWYHVNVGISKRDRAAASIISSLAKFSNDYFFEQNSLSVSTFIENVASSLIPTRDSIPKVSLLRHKSIDVVQLASFIRKNPPSFLNSKSVI